MKAAAVEPGDDPMQHQDAGKQLQRQWWLLAARPHPLARQIGVNPQERGSEDGRQNGEVNPEDCNPEGASRTEQGHCRQNEENRTLDIG